MIIVTEKMFGRLNRKLFLHCLLYTLGLTAIPAAVLWMTEAGKIFEFILTGAAGGVMFLKFALYTLAPALAHLIPPAALCATLIILTRLHGDSSLTALWAAGIRPSFLARPLLAVGLFFGVLTLSLTVYLAPQSARLLRDMVFTLESDLARGLLKPGVFQSPSPEVTVFIRDLTAGGRIDGFFLRDTSEKTETRIFAAESAIFTGERGNLLTLLNGAILTLPETEDKRRATFKFEKFTLDLTAVREATFPDKPSYKARDYTLTDLLDPPESVSGSERTRFIAKGHEQIAAGLYPLVYILIAAVFLLRPLQPRCGVGRQIFYAVSCAGGLKILSATVQNQAFDNANLIAFIYAPPAIALIICVGRLFYISRSRLSVSPIRRIDPEGAA